jgi:hypothetical protein
MKEGLVNTRVKYGILVCYFVVLAAAVVIGAYQLQGDPGSVAVRFVVYGVTSMLLMVVGAMMGGITKKLSVSGIGEWRYRTSLLSVKEYEEALSRHEEDFKVFYDDTSNAGGCCVTLFAAYLFYVAVAVIPEGGLDPSFWFTPTATLLIVLGHSFLGLVSYVIGYFSVPFNVGEFFVAPDDRVRIRAKMLEDEKSLVVKSLVKTGERDDLQAIFETEWRVYLDGLPDTVYIQVKAEKADIYDYPYLVGIMVNGPDIVERTEHLDIGTRFPGIIEYSSDSDASVLVARFEIPSDSSELEYEPNITAQEFRKLAKALAKRLIELGSE